MKIMIYFELDVRNIIDEFLITDQDQILYHLSQSYTKCLCTMFGQRFTLNYTDSKNSAALCNYCMNPRYSCKLKSSQEYLSID